MPTEKQKKLIPVLINGKIKAEWDQQTIICKCGERIGFAITARGKRMPINLDELHTTHFATCKKSVDFRKARTDRLRDQTY